MLEKISPANVYLDERTDDVVANYLYPQEREQIRHAGEKRQKEFSTVRWCARQAMKNLGVAPAAILNGSSREPLWPEGIVGSMTHCTGYRAAVVARIEDYISIGIDVELHRPLPPGIVDLIADEEERHRLKKLKYSNPEVNWPTLLFSIKESIFKAWFPVTHRWLDFHQASVEIDPKREIFTAQLDPTCQWRYRSQLCGCWRITQGLILTTLYIPNLAI